MANKLGFTPAEVQQAYLKHNVASPSIKLFKTFITITQDEKERVLNSIIYDEFLMPKPNFIEICNEYSKQFFDHEKKNQTADGNKTQFVF